MKIVRTGNRVVIGRLEITADRWPWQRGYGWAGAGHATSAPLNRGGARFGGGWKYELGIKVGSTTVILSLLFGMLRFTLKPKAR